MSIPTWYAILGVEPSATPEEIKAAWRDATDKFEPGSGAGQFRLFNEAADVLLDPARRAEYDASLVVQPAPVEPAAVHPDTDTDAGPEPAPVEPAEERDQEHEPDLQTSGRFPWNRVLGLVLVVAVVCCALLAVGISRQAHRTGATFLQGVHQDREVARDHAGASAAAAADRALTAALSYDYRHMETDRSRALGFMTTSYGKKFADTFDKLLVATEPGKPSNVVRTRTVVSASVLQVGVMNPAAVTADRVRVLAYVNQSAVKGERTPAIFQNRVAVTMVRHDGTWLIDGLASY